MVIGTRLFLSFLKQEKGVPVNIYEGKKAKDQRREDLLDQWRQQSSVAPTLQMWSSEPGARGAPPSSRPSPQVAGDTDRERSS